MTLRLTNSEMSDYRRCRRRWWLKHYRWLTPREFEFGTPAALGTRIHKALERFYSSAGIVDLLEALEDTFAADIEKFPAREADIRGQEELAKLMLEGYLQWLEESGADSELKIIGAEVNREVPFAIIDSTDVTLMAKLDLHATRDAEILSVDFKTVQNFAYSLVNLKMNTQMLTQHLVEFLDAQESDKRATGTIYRMLRKVKRTASAKPPFYAEETVRHNETELRNHWYHVYGIAQEIYLMRQRLGEGENHQVVCPPSPTRDCSWDCDFFKVCVMLDDGSDAEMALSDLYVTKDPLERYIDEEVGALNA